MATKNVKKKNLYQLKVCSNCFAPTHIKFNFSFITYEDDFTDEHKLQLLKRMRELSSVPYIELQSWRKNIGLEFERVKIKKDIAEEFFAGHSDFIDGKYAIFRLYPNDNPICARVIGKVIRNVFYIFYIDIGGNLYNH